MAHKQKFSIPDSTEDMILFLRTNPSPACPYMPLYIHDFLASTRVRLMDVTAKGAYIMLLMAAWDAEDCGLPEDDLSLSTLSTLNDRWNEYKNTVLLMFVKYENKWYNKRVLRERIKAFTQWNQRVNAGKAGVKARKVNKIRVRPDGLPNGSTKTQRAIGLDWIGLKSENTTEGINSSVTPPEESKPLPESLQIAMKEFAEMRQKMRAPLTQTATKRLISKLRELSGGSTEVAVKIVQQSTDRAWRGFFPLGDGAGKSVTISKPDTSYQDRKKEIEVAPEERATAEEIEGIWDSVLSKTKSM